MPGKNVPFPPMEAELVRELPEGDGWQYEPKWDGLNVGETMFPPRTPFFTFAASRCSDDSERRSLACGSRSGCAGKAGTSVGKSRA